jgi:hypothetical protein
MGARRLAAASPWNEGGAERESAWSSASQSTATNDMPEI